MATPPPYGHPDLEAFFDPAKPWSAELSRLRAIVLASGLDETWKWRTPCYTDADRNVILLGRFKTNCTLTFFRGAVLSDPHGILLKPGANTRVPRLLRFTGTEEIDRLAPILRAYIEEAIAAERADLKPERRSASPELPAELTARFTAQPALERSFAALTPGRRRAYLLHFSGAKQSATRTARIERCAPRILAGKGLNDCICGHSRRMPTCDGSHKYH
ncbi:DUF1801 domain-containing protein [Lewinella sp. JB7]|uniref:DUF1801 domain-containing protein n=1 Tax=Lewinella sp. JB7 TaxID=2962887 RepID=UPI0020C96E1D|nr:YdeI/OmpD-associated family protein [Lewinella sp. JB7]MCP9234636.1 YdeI/OmpD-associated family protein [Lewinella sp. JB7]